MRDHHVSITRSGHIKLDRGFIQRYGINKGMAVELHADDEDAIRIDFIHASDAIDRESLPIVIAPFGRSACIDATSFFKNFDLAPYADTPLPIRYVLTDNVAMDFIVYLDRSLTPAA